MPYFDDLMTAADDSLDAVFAGPAWFRAGGLDVAITASVRSLRAETDNEPNMPSSWIGYVVECYPAELLVNGAAYVPVGGEEIAFPQPNGSKKVFLIGAGPDGRPYSPLDSLDRKWLLYCKFARTET